MVAMRRSRSARYETIGLAHVGTLLAEAIGDPRRVQAALGVWPAWEEAVGPAVAAAARPVSLRDGVLTVAVKNAVWMQELHPQRGQILGRVQRVSGGAAVQSVNFRVMPAQVPESFVGRETQRVAAGPVPFEIAQGIKQIESARLRGTLIRVAARWSGLQRARRGRD